MRIGAVNYLNSKPLVYGLEASAAAGCVSYDLPSRLADSLAAGRLDVALIAIGRVVAAAGLHNRVRCLCRLPRAGAEREALFPRAALPTCGRLRWTKARELSAALALILLEELAGVTPRRESLPIGAGLADSTADAMLLIGDRAMQNTSREFVEIWDLGSAWLNWVGLPFVFAMWVARPGVETTAVADMLAAARDGGVAHLAEIAAKEGPSLGIEPGSALQLLARQSAL